MILRTELRRSAAPVIGIGLLVCALALIYSLSGPWWKDTAAWNEQWTGLAQWMRYLLSFLWPLVAGAGVWQGLRDARSGVDELFATTPKAAWRRVLPLAGAVALAVTAACVVLFVVGGVQVARTTTYHHLKWVPVAGVMVLSLVGIALLGMGIGRLLPWLVVPPVVAVAALAAQASSFMGGVPLLLTPTFQTWDINVFRTVAVPVTLTQVLWFAGLGAAGYCLLVARRKIVALVPLLLSAAVAVPFLSNADKTVPDLDARALVCDENGPRVCMTRAHSDALPAVVGPAREALALLEKLPDPPTSVVELPPDGEIGQLPAGATPLFLLLPTENPEEIRSLVLGGIGMPPCPTDTNGDFRKLGTEIVVTSWLIGELAPLPGYDYVWETKHKEIKQAWQELRALSPDEQAEQVAAWRNATLTCGHELAL
ncbi:hypothetical protein [Actinophytocola sp.]|uniref:hypothetical protein n=1 Tax=Actinophytocola sp. TaxID=1872138 RepID=UPI002ED4E7C4